MVGPLRKPVINRARPTRIARRPLRGQLALSLRPRERLAARRRRARIIALVVGIFLVGAGVWALGLASHHDRLAIQDVTVSGTKALSVSAIKTSFETKLQEGAHAFFSRANIFLYPKETLSRALLQEFPRIETVSVSRESLLAQAVTITVREREARYRWCKGSHCYLMDNTGYIFSIADIEETEYIFRGGLVPTEEPVGQTFLRGRLERVLDLLTRLHDAGFTATDLTVENETDMQVALAKGFYLKAAFAAEPADVVKNLETAVVSEAVRDDLDRLEYIDLRFGNRVYFQMR